ncbi:hypothetical protein BKP45_05185 [Anaerobacillus alkalidiazotrophicus]|uniref:Histone deacetylase n=2 Tax=Anaerobacillus alkalidiazotrophicus TaxID=472963 RepID=A0A1S2MCI3_9BACI|nr:hypothetical protein BKP45_05185 [Anaerobacillus alkalidiazotrophicus]
MKQEKYVWYASYGSNLSRDRFLCYIKGGQPKGSEKIEVGCLDKSLPIKEETYIINHPLYFAKESIRWQNQGVAFIGLTKAEKYKTFSRKYLITLEQFLDVVKQENNGATFSIELDEVMQSGSKTFRESWYGTILYLGDNDEGIPIFTFTSDWDLDVSFNKPSNEYLSMIIEGLKKNVLLSDIEIVNYLSTKQGIEGFYNKVDIEKLMNKLSK